MSKLELSITEVPSNMSFIYEFKNQCITHISAPVRKTFKLESDCLSLDGLRKYVYEEDRDFLNKSISEVLAGEAKPFIVSRFQIDNEERWFQFSLIRVKSGDDDLMLANVEEVTSELENLHSIQRYANKKNSILQILAHDLRGPLGIAKMSSQLAKHHNTDERIETHLQTITRVIEQAINLIRDLTNREFVETVDVALIKKRIDIALKIREYVEELRRSETPAKRNFNFSSSADSIFIMLDEAKFMQIMNNLINNALKFTQDGGNIDIVVEDQEDFVRFSIKDDGIGIPDELQDEIFKPESKAGRTGLHGEESTGMGLHIVKTIVEWHNGSIWFKSRENAGTSVYIEIPKLSS